MKTPPRKVKKNKTNTLSKIIYMQQIRVYMQKQLPEVKKMDS